jgi:hypothetical protein
MRWLTFKDLKARGWPYSRQHTGRLVNTGMMPRPKKRPGGGSLNLWDEAEFDAYYATFQTAVTSQTESDMRTAPIK